MKILFISRKRIRWIGGLSRFYVQLSSYFPQSFLKADLIHLCDATLLSLGVILKLIFRKPLTLTAHGLDLTYKNPIYQLTLRLLLPKVDAVIAVSEATGNLLNKFNIKKERVFVIPNGISVTHLISPTSPSLPNLPNLKGKLILLTVGNLVIRKGHAWFLRKVFRKLPKKFIYLIVGKGSERDSIEETIRRLRLHSRVFLLGALTHSRLAYIYSKAHIYVCPNQHIEGDFEGFGIACGEAAAMGLPVVASNVDGIGGIIQNGKNGILVEPTPQAFIEAINRLKNPLIRKRLGQKAKIYTGKYYSWQKTAQKYAQAFKTVL